MRTFLWSDACVLLEEHAMKKVLTLLAAAVGGLLTLFAGGLAAELVAVQPVAPAGSVERLNDAAATFGASMRDEFALMKTESARA
jgi:hypothetical protein